MVLRTFRLDQPQQMHFDEVYHARTATEFLQDWRYGLSHDIYEWTHPHLAKYLMAAGIVLWGGDHVETTSDLGVPVVATAVEARRIDPVGANAPAGDTSGVRAGERLHVATGTEIRTYDLRTRALLSTIPAPGVSALAIDDTGQRLVIGYADGRLATLDLDQIGTGGVGAPSAPTALATVDHPVDHLLVVNAGAQVIAASDSRLTSVDAGTGTVIGSLDLSGIADLAPGGSGSAVVATKDDVTDPSAVAASLATILGTSAPDLQDKLASASPGTTVVLGAPGSDDVRTKLDTAIADGKLPGIRVDAVTRVAVATDAGVAFVDPDLATVVTTIKLAGGAHGLAQVTGIDDPKLYATSGGPDAPSYDVIAIGGDSAKDGPTDQAPGLGLQPLPGPGTWVAYDPASQMVHILGLAQDATAAGPWTVYVVEPHGNAVYADARLPDGFVPSAWGADFNPDYPSEDRQQLLLFDGAGASASIDAGSHSFAWRLPGVIAGAITAALLYLLTRILFRRRLIAGLVGLFVIADGMFFVQSRIGMNDVYVGLFIVAAYTVFAAIWTGWWKGRAAFWIAMPVIGVLLGLALASKWVAAYAIGALILLILVRSALGRVLAILGMIGITGVLGYMAISVPPAVAGGDPGFGNMTFLLIMIALTLLTVFVAVVHPVAWTDDEMRFGIGAPVVVGALVFFGALAAGKARRDGQARVARGHAGGDRDPVRARVAGRVRAVLARRPDRVRPARRATRPGRPDPAARAARGAGGGVAAPRLAGRDPGRVDARLRHRPPTRRVRHQLHPVGDDREPPDRPWLAARAHGSDAARPDRSDVRVSQRPDGGPSRVVAVVGLAAQPEARVVLPGVAGRRHLGRAVRRRQPRHLVARHPGHRVRVVDGVPAPQRGPGARGHRLRGPVDPVGADRPGGLPVPLLHGAAIRGDGAGLLHGRAVARGVAPYLGARPDRRRAGDHGTGADVAARAGPSAPSSGSTG